jgi:ketosteroid isomerase-like protein
MIARLKEELSPLVIHELFHVYQEERLGDPSKAFFWSMWTEGLATYVSRRLNPGVPEQQVCCLPPIEPVEAALPKIAAEALALFDSEKSDEYARFFYGNQKIDIPQRSGYYLGYRIASEAGKTRSLRDLAGLTPDQVRPLARRELERMAGAGAKATAATFHSLMETVAAGWNEGDARKAADCFAEDALYLEPPDRQFYSGRPALYEFFGGATKPEPPMKMTWHQLAFDEESQVGFGEYTFQMNRRYHGVVIVKILGGKIANWREYQYPSDLDWSDFVRKNPF